MSSLIKILNGAKVTRSTSAYALPLFLPAPKIRAKITFQKYILGSNPKIPFPTSVHSVLTYHFLVPIGALENTTTVFLHISTLYNDVLELSALLSKPTTPIP